MYSLYSTNTEFGTRVVSLGRPENQKFFYLKDLATNWTFSDLNIKHWLFPPELWLFICDGSLMNGFGVQFAETFERCNKSIWTYYQFIILIIISSCCFSLYGTLYLWLINNIVIRSSWLGQRPWIWIPCKSQESRWPRRSKSTIGFCCCQTKTKCVVSQFSFSYMTIWTYILFFPYFLTCVYFYVIEIQ